jgi:hypothetical protein
MAQQQLPKKDQWYTGMIKPPMMTQPNDPDLVAAAVPGMDQYPITSHPPLRRIQINVASWLTKSTMCYNYDSTSSVYLEDPGVSLGYAPEFRISEDKMSIVCLSCNKKSPIMLTKSPKDTSVATALCVCHLV